MRTPPPKALAGLVAATISVVAASAWSQSPAPAAAPAKTPDPAERCVAAADRGQALRDEGRLVDARAEFAACGADECPAVVRRECVRWLAEVDERAPSVIFTVKSAGGRDVVGASVALDGKPLPAGGMGRALALDPGPHKLVVRHPAHRPFEQQVVVREREKGRVIELALVPTDPGTEPRTVPWLTWVLGGVAVAGGAGFGVFWNQGMSDVSDMRRDCAPYCSQERIDDVRPTFLAARISLGVGIAAAVGAIAAYVFQPTRSRSPVDGAAPPFVLRPQALAK